MAFSSLLFVCAFMPLCIVATWTAPARWRNAGLLFFSVVFYAWGARRFLPIVLLLCVVDLSLARAIQRVESTGRRRALVAAGICVHVSVLAYFKYANFFVAQADHVGVHVQHWQRVALPIGVSFLTFEEISYLVDVYRGAASPARRPTDYALLS